MGWRERWRRPVRYSSTPGVPFDAGRSATVQFGSVVVPYSMTARDAAGGTAATISRADALTVPAMLRARNLIAGTLGGLPLKVHNPQRELVDPAVLTSANLLSQPEAARPRSVTMAALYEDLLLDGIAWWRVTEWGWDNYPKRVRRLDPAHVNVRPDGTVWLGGEQLRDDEVIRFDSPNPGLVKAAARAIRTCLALDAAAARYANEPMPLGFFTPADGVDPLDEDAVQDVLDGWESARQRRVTGYVGGGLKYQQTQYSAVDIQLADARQHAVLEIARATGLDPEDLGVSTTSRTYQNAEQRRMDLVDFTLAPYANAVQDRLSMGDVTPRGYYTRVKFEGLVRGDTKTRYETYGIGQRVGAVARDEVRAAEDRPQLTPAQQREIAPAPTPQEAKP